MILAYDGYPVSYEKGFVIDGLEKFRDKEDYYVFHSGTKFNGQGQIVTNGGRVLGVTANGATVKAVKEISFANKYYRTDIARAVDEA